MNPSSHRLYKSRDHRLIAGVCGGIAEYFAVDVTLVRILWVLATIFGGWGLLVYIAAALLMPSKPVVVAEGTTVPPPPQPRESSSPVWGILLIVAGVLWVAANLGFHIFFPWWGLSWKSGIGVLLIIAGVMVLVDKRSILSGIQQSATSPSGTNSPSNSAPVRLRRSRKNNMVFGVCGGIAEYLHVDPVIVRLLVVIAALGSVGLVLLAYLILAAALPMEDGGVEGSAIA